MKYNYDELNKSNKHEIQEQESRLQFLLLGLPIGGAMLVVLTVIVYSFIA